jgi:hypothetical protein
MQTLEDAETIERAPYKKNRYRITLNEGPSVWDSISDRSLTSHSVPVDVCDVALEATPQQHALPGMIDQFLPNGTHEIHEEGEESRAHANSGRDGGRAVEPDPRTRIWLDLGVWEEKLGVVLTSGIAPHEFRKQAAIAAAQGARSPIGVVVSRLERGLAVVDAREWAGEAPPPSHAPRAAPRERRRQPGSPTPEQLRDALRAEAERQEQAGHRPVARAAPPLASPAPPPRRASAWVRTQLEQRVSRAARPFLGGVEDAGDDVVRVRPRTGLPASYLAEIQAAAETVLLAASSRWPALQRIEVQHAS